MDEITPILSLIGVPMFFIGYIWMLIIVSKKGSWLWAALVVF
ncbi:MAG: hypothetical protein ACR2LT_10010 [Pyrinomonadaceae bacterium]